MPSPFPGMDPYVGARWRTFHGHLASAITSGLNQVLPASLEARLEEEVRIESVAGDELRRGRPDVAMVELGPADGGGPAVAPGTVAVADPEEIVIRRLRIPVVRRSVYIVDLDRGDRLVTAVEVLSPANKRSGPRNREYRRKLRDCHAAGVNWVEVDLLRSSRARLRVPWTAVPPDRRAAYLVVTSRAGDRTVRARPVGLRRPLPPITVPTRAGEADVRLDLQAAFTRAYADARFGSIDYAQPPAPPLPAADAAWAAELLAGRGSPGP